MSNEPCEETCPFPPLPIEELEPFYIVLEYNPIALNHRCTLMGLGVSDADHLKECIAKHLVLGPGNWKELNSDHTIFSTEIPEGPEGIIIGLEKAITVLSTVSSSMPLIRRAVNPNPLPTFLTGPAGENIFKRIHMGNQNSWRWRQRGEEFF